MRLVKIICLFLYYGFAMHLPNSYLPIIGKYCNFIRVILCKVIFLQCGKISTVNKLVKFGSGSKIVIGDYSGIGARCEIPNNIKIGRYVMMGEDVLIIPENHIYENLTRPMCFQGHTVAKQTIIEDDVWIGSRVIMTPGRIVKKGTIIGVGTVLTKNFEENSVVGGNPARMIKYRM
jgi:maltose O-acetyltransferase